MADSNQLHKHTKLSNQLVKKGPSAMQKTIHRMLFLERIRDIKTMCNISKINILYDANNHIDSSQQLTLNDGVHMKSELPSEIMISD